MDNFILRFRHEDYAGAVMGADRHGNSTLTFTFKGLATAGEVFKTFAKLEQRPQLPAEPKVVIDDTPPPAMPPVEMTDDGIVETAADPVTNALDSGFTQTETQPALSVGPATMDDALNRMKAMFGDPTSPPGQELDSFLDPGSDPDSTEGKSHDSAASADPPPA